jgi:uncharacterized protein
MSFSCTKCSHKSYDTAEVSTTGDALSRMFDFSQHIFTAVICEKCGFTELYKKNSSGLGNLLDGLGSV